MTGGVCVERKLLSARASLGMPELQKQTGRVQTLLEVLITQRNAQVQTLCSSQSQQAPALFDAFAGLMPLTGSCGLVFVVFGCRTANERSPLSSCLSSAVAISWRNKPFLRSRVH